MDITSNKTTEVKKICVITFIYICALIIRLARLCYDPIIPRDSIIYLDLAQKWNETGNYLSFSAENITVNDFTLEMPFNTTPYEQIVLNKCQGLFTIELDEETLEGAGITSVEKLEYTLHVQPLESYSDDWDTELMGDIVEPEFLY